MEEFLDIMWNQMTFYEKKVARVGKGAKSVELDGEARCVQYPHGACIGGHKAGAGRAEIAE